MRAFFFSRFGASGRARLFPSQGAENVLLCGWAAVGADPSTSLEEDGDTFRKDELQGHCAPEVEVFARNDHFDFCDRGQAKEGPCLTGLLTLRLFYPRSVPSASPHLCSFNFASYLPGARAQVSSVLNRVIFGICTAHNNRARWQNFVALP